MAVQKRDDALWKSILETVFGDFLLFFYPQAEEIFDLAAGFVYLDKELEALFPPEEGKGGVRFVDKLVKVFLKDGSEKYILVHVEVQSHRGRNDLEARMFEYFYLVKNRYGVPVTAVAILADGNRSYLPGPYVEELLGTRLTYEFTTYKILAQDEGALRADPNPFAVVVLTALLALKRRGADDGELKAIKHDLYGEMMARQMPKEKRQGIYDFLTYFVRFENPEMLRIFESEIRQKQGKEDTMGTREYLLEKAKKEGIEKERARAEAEKREMAREMKNDGFPIERIAKLTKLSIEEVEQL